MKYNEKYISDYVESRYIKYLSDSNLLNVLISKYNSRYSENGKVDGQIILFQESLNNYVIKRVKNDPTFIKTEYFKNYRNYLQQSFKYTNSFFFHNPFLHAFNADELRNMLGSDLFNQISINASDSSKIVNVINKKIANNEQLTQTELNRICDVYAFNRDQNNEYHKKLIEYIFKNLTDSNSNLVCSKYVLDAILAYIPKNYPKIDKFDAINSRIIADDINLNGVAISHGQSHIFVNRDIFKKTNFKSIEDSKKTFIKKGNDFTFLMVVANHELTHQYQTYMSQKQEFSNEGYMWIKRYVLDRELHDYKENHDNDDIEIDATEKSWDVCARFYQEFLSENNFKSDLLNQCKLNMQGTANRRFEYMKKDDRYSTVNLTSFYDVINLNDAIGKNPQYLQNFPMLKTFYTSDGNISLDFLKINNIGNKSVGTDYVSFMCLNYPRKVLDYLNSLNENDLNSAIENITQGFRNFLKPIRWFDYNSRNKLDGEYKKNKDSDAILLILYQKSLELYRNINFIFSNEQLMMKTSFLQGNKDVVDRTMNFTEEQYNRFKK